MDKAELICSEKIYRYLEESSYNGKFDEAIEVLFGGSRYLDEFFDLLKQKYLKAGADEVKAGLLAQKTHDFFTEKGYDISSLTDELAEVLVKAEDGVQILARLQGWDDGVFDVFLKDLADPNLKGIFRAEWVEAWEISVKNLDLIRLNTSFLTTLTKHLQNFPALKYDLIDNDVFRAYKLISDDLVQSYEILDEIDGNLAILIAQKTQNSKAKEFWKWIQKGKQFESEFVLPRLIDRTSSEYIQLKKSASFEFNIDLDEYDMYSQVQLKYDNQNYFIADQIYVKWVNIGGQNLIDDAVIIENKLSNSTRLTSNQLAAKSATYLEVRSLSVPSESPVSDIILVQGMRFDSNDKWLKLYDSDNGEKISGIEKL